MLDFGNNEKETLNRKCLLSQGPLLYLISVLQASALIVAHASQVRAPAMLLQIVRDYRLWPCDVLLSGVMFPPLTDFFFEWK
jgi:hypothetical protein